MSVTVEVHLLDSYDYVSKPKKRPSFLGDNDFYFKFLKIFLKPMIFSAGKIFSINIILYESFMVTIKIEMDHGKEMKRWKFS